MASVTSNRPGGRCAQFRRSASAKIDLTAVEDNARGVPGWLEPLRDRPRLQQRRPVRRQVLAARAAGPGRRSNRDRVPPRRNSQSAVRRPSSRSAAPIPSVCAPSRPAGLFVVPPPRVVSARGSLVKNKSMARAIIPIRQALTCEKVTCPMY
jgi:hypothetical protein